MSVSARAARRASGAWVVGLLAVVPSGPASAGPSQLPLPTAAADALAGAGRAEALVGTGGFLGAVRGLVALAGVDAEAANAVLAQVPPGTPPSLAAPVSSLLGALEEAGRLTQAAVPADHAALLEANRRLTDAMRDPTGEALKPFLVLAERVDTKLFARAALVVAGAVERALPALKDAPVAPGNRQYECDVLDAMPAVCIGGYYSNTYTADAALLIDLGGDDLYLNSAGSGDPDRNGIPAALLIDVAGNDRYEATLPTSSGSYVAQGGGYVGGLGALVDLEGDDSYSAVSGISGKEAYGQGVSAVGVGLFADLQGDDSYLIESTRPVNTAGNAFQISAGQAYASLGGLALAADRDGDDTYVLRSALTPWVEDRSVWPGPGDSRGFASSVVGGVALFAESGGTDDITVEAASGPFADAYDSIGPSTAEIWGMGYAGAGTSLALTGSGPTTWQATAAASGPTVSSGESPRSAAVTGFGFGALGGLAVVRDEGGDDRYMATSTVTAHRTLGIDDACGCVKAESKAEAANAQLYAMGYGSTGGAGLLADDAGNDLYRLESRSVAEAEAHDTRAAPATGAEAAATAKSSAAQALGQGGGVITGYGLLLDGAGDDVYESSTSSEARATADAGNSKVRRSASATSSTASSMAQGASVNGHGDLRDLGGADRYSSTNISVAEVDPLTFKKQGAALSSVQGSTDAGTATLLDYGAGADVFTTTPADPVCQGTRGVGIWRDCGTGAAIGVNA